MKKILCLLLSFTMFLAPCFAFDNKDLNVAVSNVPLTTQLSKYYQGYEYTLLNQSKTKSKINIVNAQIINGYDGNFAYTNTMNNEPSAMARTWIIAGPAGLFTLGIGWVVGLIATPIVAIVSNKNKKRTQIESLAYSNLIQLNELNYGESTHLSTLVPIGSKPQLKLTVQDEKTEKLHAVIY